MAHHSSTLALKIPWMEEPGRLQSMGSLRVRHDWAASLSLFTFMHWRRKWQPTPVFLPGEFHGQRSLVGYKPMGLQKAGHNQATNTLTFKHVIGWAAKLWFLLRSLPLEQEGISGAHLRAVPWEKLFATYTLWNVFHSINWLRRSNNDENSSKTFLWNKVKDYKGTSGASLIAHLVKNLPAMQETPVRFLGQEDPLEKR